MTHTDSDFSHSVSFLTCSAPVRTECTLENFLASLRDWNQNGVCELPRSRKRRGDNSLEDQCPNVTGAQRRKRRRLRGPMRPKGEGTRKRKWRQEGDIQKYPRGSTEISCAKPKHSPNPRRNDPQGRKGSRERSKSPSTPKGAESTRKTSAKSRKLELAHSGTEIEERAYLPGLSHTLGMPERRAVSAEPPSDQWALPTLWQQGPLSGRMQAPKVRQESANPRKGSICRRMGGSRCSTPRRGGRRCDSLSLPFLSSLIFPEL